MRNAKICKTIMSNVVNIFPQLFETNWSTSLYRFKGCFTLSAYEIVGNFHMLLVTSWSD